MAAVQGVYLGAALGLGLLRRGRAPLSGPALAGAGNPLSERPAR
jgi:hypothetical protein